MCRESLALPCDHPPTVSGRSWPNSLRNRHRHASMTGRRRRLAMNPANSLQTVLIVDDYKLALEQFKRTFQRHNFTVLDASTAEEALQRVSKTTPTLIVLDLLLESGSSLDLLSTLHKRFPSVPI